MEEEFVPNTTAFWIAHGVFAAYSIWWWWWDGRRTKRRMARMGLAPDGSTRLPPAPKTGLGEVVDMDEWKERNGLTSP